MEPGSCPQPELCALGILGKLKLFGECRIVVAHVAEVLDQAVVQRVQEIVRACGAVVLLRIKPARCDVGVPRKDQLAGRRHWLCACRAGAGCNPGEGRGASSQDPASAERVAPGRLLLRVAMIPSHNCLP
jgi:hypothetical protein